MSQGTSNLTIGALARAAGVHVETVRFYQRRGLLPLPKRAYGSIRRYGHDALMRLRFIKSAQRLGFSLDEVAGLLRLEDGDHCDEVREQAEHRLADVRLRLRELRRMEAALQALIRDCRQPHAARRCPLIEALQGDFPVAAVSSKARNRLQEKHNG